MNILILIAGVFNLVLGAVVLRKARNDIQKKFAYLVFLIAFWVFVNYIYYQFPRYPYVNLTYSVGALLIGGIFFWAAAYAKLILKPVVKFAIIIYSVVLFFLALIPNLVIAMQVLTTPRGFEIADGKYFLLYAIPSSCILIWAVSHLVQMRHQASGLERMQLNYVLLGFAAPIFIIIIIDFASPLHHVLWLARFDSLTALVFASFISYAITRYRFFNIQFVIRKGIVQFFSFAILFITYAYLIVVLQQLTQYAILTEGVKIFIAILIVGFTAEPLRRLIYSFVDRIFVSREKEQSDSLQRLQLVAQSSVHFNDLVEKIRSELARVLPEYDGYILQRSSPDQDFRDNKGGVNIAAHGELAQFLRMRQEILVVDELPYRLERFSNEEARLLKSAQNFLRENHIRALLPFGHEDTLTAIGVLVNKSSRAILFAEQIAYLKKLYVHANSALVQAEMYRMAIARAVKGVAED